METILHIYGTLQTERGLIYKGNDFPVSLIGTTIQHSEARVGSTMDTYTTIWSQEFLNKCSGESGKCILKGGSEKLQKQ